MMKLGRGLVMKSRAYDLARYSFASGEQVLIDANIWLYMFPAPGNPPYKHASNYSKAFQNLKMANAEPVLDFMILSEYLNRYCRIEWEANHKSAYPKFKDFRVSSDFTVVASTAHTFATKILSFCKAHSVRADELDLKAALTDFQSGKLDFNDAVIVEVCKKRNLKLMTNDGDFEYGGIELLTTNPKLLSACP